MNPKRETSYLGLEVAKTPFITRPRRPLVVVWQWPLRALREFLFSLASPAVVFIDIFRANGPLGRAWVARYLVITIAITSLAWAVNQLITHRLEEAIQVMNSYTALQGNLNDVPYADLIVFYAMRNELDPALVAAVIKKESQFESNAVSPAGARGLMQIQPETWKSLYPESSCDGNHPPPATGEDCIFNPAANIRIGTRYLRQLITEFDGDVVMAFAAYNAGSSAVRRFEGAHNYDGIPPYRETQSYVREVVSNWWGLLQRPISPNYDDPGTRWLKRVYQRLPLASLGLLGILFLWVAKRKTISQ